MSGIAGVISQKVLDHRTRFHLIDRWHTLLHHRGPDDWGWHYIAGSVLLFHCRLTAAGVEKGIQPLPDEQKTIWLLFNGALCGHKELRKDMEAAGHRFRTDLDAEIVIHLYEEYGMDAVNHLRGEFAFALYDTRIQKIFLVRDRFGVKPLYYAHTKGRQFYFASEAKAIFADELFPRHFDMNVIRNYTNTFYFGTETPFEGIKQVAPGNYLCYDLTSDVLNQNCYWRLPLGSAPASGTDADLTAEFLHMLREAVKIRIPAERSFGAFLSGGLDSSAITSLLCLEKENSFPVFTLGFNKAHYDESSFAQQLATKFNLPHHNVKVGQGTLKEMFIRSVWHSEIPVLNTHGAAKMLLSKRAGQHCKVLFTGEGADELLWGYGLFRHLKAAEGSVTKNGGGRILLMQGSMAGRLKHYQEVSNTFGAYPYSMLRHFYIKRISSWLQNSAHRHSSGDLWDWKKEIYKHIPPDLMKGLNSVELTQLFLLSADFPAYILNYLGDRQEMSMGVEGRPPFLDHKLAEFTCRLPDHLKLRNGVGKYILREAMKGYLPDDVRFRSKQVFYAPAFESIDLFIDADYFKQYTAKAAFDDTGIFSPAAFKTMVLFSQLLPAGNRLLPVIESVVIFMLSLHILHDLYIRRFDYWCTQFAPPSCIEDFEFHNTGVKYA
jgi:asparagine synthase (glutamine-hydrolysing)